jgi:hypothetical protein
MEENQGDILSDIVLQINNVKRKQLLPWWIKVFMWIFLVFGVFAPFGLILAIFGFDFQLSLYGLETNNPISIIGIIIMAIFLFKGITAYGFFREKDWAITLGIIDSISGIFICILVMIFPLTDKTSHGNNSFRLELVLLVPYLIKMIRIKSAWEQAAQI